MAKHFDLTITDTSFRYTRNEGRIREEAALDGLYVVCSSVERKRMDSDRVVETYKSLAKVERAFRCMKTIDLSLRPIYQWSEGVERYPIVAAYQIAAGLREDLNGDGAVDGLDIAISFSAWGTTSGQADVNLDRIVDGGDIGRLFSAWTGDVRVASLPEPTAIRRLGY